MKYPMTLLAVTVLFFCNIPGNIFAQDNSSLKEKGYEPLSITAKYVFYNDLNEITDGGSFENLTAGFRKTDGAYELLIDLGWTKEIIYVDLIEFIAAGQAPNGLDYQRSVFSDGREEIFITIHIDNKIAFYSSEKEFIP